MKKTVRFTALLLAVIMIICACNPETLTSTDGTLTIEGRFPYGCSYGEILIDGSYVNTYSGEKIQLSLKAGEHELEIQAFNNSTEKKLINKYKSTITIKKLQTTEVMIQPYDWVEVSDKAILKFQSDAYPGATKYRFEFRDNAKNHYYVLGSNKYTRDYEFNLAKYELYSYAYKDGVLVATAEPFTIEMLEKGKTYDFSFTEDKWKPYTGTGVEKDFHVNVPPFKGADSYSIIMDGKLLNKNGETTVEKKIRSNRSYFMEFYGFKNGKMIAWADTFIETPTEDTTFYGFSQNLFEKRGGILSFSYNNCEGADAYGFRIDGKPVQNLNTNLSRGDHHIEAYALKDGKPIAARYFDINIDTNDIKEINLTSWENPFDEKTITDLASSFFGATEGKCRVMSLPLNRLTPEMTAMLEAGLNQAIKGGALPGIPSDTVVTCTVEDELFTASLKYDQQYPDSTSTYPVSMKITQDKLGQVLLVTEADFGARGKTTQTRYFTILPDYGFEYAKQPSFRETVVGKSNNASEEQTWVVFHVEDKAELEKILAMNGLDASTLPADWDTAEKEHRFTTNIDKIYSGIRILSKDENGYGVSLWEIHSKTKNN